MLRRTRSLVALAAIGALIAGITFAATRAQGREGTAVHANDGGAWLLKRDAGVIGHLNREVLEVTASLRVSVPGTDFDVDQAPGSIIVHDRSAATATVIDPRTNLPRATTLVPADVHLRAIDDGVVLWTVSPLKVWELDLEDLLTTADLDGLDPTYEQASDGAVAVGTDVTTIWVEDESTLVRLDRHGSPTVVREQPLDHPVDGVTSVGSTAVVAATDQLLIDRGPMTVTNLNGPLVLQQPSGAQPSVALIDATGTIQLIDLDSGRATPGPSVGGTRPLPPIHVDGCVFAVASEPPTFTRACGDDIQATPLSGAGPELRLRLVNGWVWINDLDSGGAWLTDAHTDLARIDDWGVALGDRHQDEAEATTEDVGGTDETRIAPDDNAAEMIRADEHDEDGENEPPVARDDHVETRVDRPVEVLVMANDEDADGDVLLVDRAEVLSGSSTAQMWVSADRQSVQVTPAAGFTGTIQFAYSISDGRGATADAVGTVVVNSGSQRPNRPPTPVVDLATVRAGASVSLNVLSNDTDPDGDALVLLDVSSEAGSTMFDASGQVVISPDLGRNDGSIELGYTVADDYGATAVGRIRVHVRLAEANGPPDARNDATVTSVGRPARLDVLANDRDPDGDPLIVVRSPDQSTGVTITADGELAFLPAQPGDYLFDYVISDGQATDTAQIRIVVSAPEENLPPTPSRDDATIPRGSTRLVRVLDNDGDPNGDVVGIVEWSDVDGVTIEEVPGVGFRVTANADAPDRVSFRYAVSDGQAEPVGSVVVLAIVAVESVNQPPIAGADTIEVRIGRTTAIPVLSNDYDPEGSSLRVLRTTLPTGVDVAAHVDAHGQHIALTVGPSVTRGFRFGYDVADEQGAGTAAIVDVRLVRDSEPNRLPIARADIARTTEARSNDAPALIMPVLGNDTDPDGDPLTAESIAGQPAHGEAELLLDGTIAYRPSPGFTGTDRFTYVVIDTQGGRSIGQALIGVTPRPPANRPPSANDDTIVSRSTAPILLDVLANDHDPDGDTLAILDVSTPRTGSIVVTGDQHLLYRPAPSTGSQDMPETGLSFSYRVTDGQGHTDDAVVQLLIDPAPAPAPPMATDDRAGPIRGSRSLTVDVLANDLDPDGVVGDLLLTSTDPNVTVVDRQLRVAVGARSGQYRYTITDGDGLSATAVLTVFVVENQAPSVSNLVRSTAFETPIDLSLSGQVNDSDGDVLFYVCCDNTRGGVAEIIRSDRGVLDVRFTPSAGFTGQAGFSYFVDDRAGHVVSGYAGVVVAAPTNRPPSTRPGDATIEAGDDLPFDLSSIVDDPDPGDGLSFRLDPLLDASGLSAQLSGSTLLLSAAPNASPGLRSAHFEVTDRSGATATGTVNVTIEAVRAPPPQAIADTATTNQGTPVTIDVLGNDIDPLGGGLSIRRVGTAGTGTASIVGPSVTFTPNSAFFGTATLTYTIGDASETVDREAIGQLTVRVIGRPDPPAPPSAVPGNSIIALAWTTPQANGAPIDRYRIEVSATAGTTSSEVHAGNSHVLGGLTNGQDHQVRLTAHNAAGWGPPGPWSVTVRPDTRPDTPAAPQSSFGNAELRVDWGPPTNVGSAITGYRLEIGGGTNQIVSLGAANAYTWRALSNGVEYRFRVAAVNDAGPSEWSPWSNSEHPLSAPLAPPAPTATRGDRSLAVSWVPPANGGDPISGYDVELRSSGRAIRITGGSTTRYRWADIANGVAQEFRVRAINRAPDVGQWSEWSAPIVPCDVPDATLAPTITRGDSHLGVLWSAPNDQGCGILSYNVRATGGATSKVQTAGAGSTSHLFTGLTNGTPYVIEIQAVNEEGGGPWSAASAAVAPAGPPGVASISSATAVAVGQITLGWSTVSGNGVAVTGYDVSINGGAAVFTPVTRHTATGLADNTTYSFRVRACNGVGCGAWSASVDATTWGPPTAPRAVTATAGNATWQLTWSTPAGNGGSPVVSYEVRINAGVPQASNDTTFSFDLVGATNGTTYLGEVRACNAVGCGAWSSASATPTAPPPVVSISIGTTYVGPGCAGTCARVQVNGSNFVAGSTVTLSCYDTRDGRFTGAPTTAAADGTISATPCFYGYGGETVWVTANGTESNRILWP